MLQEEELAGLLLGDRSGHSAEVGMPRFGHATQEAQLSGPSWDRKC